MAYHSLFYYCSGTSRSSLLIFISVEGRTIHSVLLFKLGVIKSLTPFDLCLFLSREQWSNHHAAFIFYKGTSHTSLLSLFLYSPLFSFIYIVRKKCIHASSLCVLFVRTDLWWWLPPDVQCWRDRTVPEFPLRWGTSVSVFPSNQPEASL